MGVVVSIGFVVLLLVLFAALAFAAYRIGQRQRRAKVKIKTPEKAPENRIEHADFKVSYIKPEFTWSGNSIGDLPVKTLTYNQNECLEDARYGFEIVGVKPTERHLPQPHKTRAHGLKTVASLSKHGFLSTAHEGSYTITDLGLNALETCSVRY
jgi:hypothetical protein